jgi:Skp family chaperone for outer membrane proteins
MEKSRMLTRTRLSWLLAGAVVLTSLALPVVAQDAAADGPIKIAVVDLERVVALSSYGKALQDKLRAFEEQVKAENTALAEAAKAIQEQAAAGAQSLSEEKLAELQKAYEDKAIEIRRFRDDKQREGQKLQQEGLKEIEVALEPVFKAVRDEGGYDLILNNTPGLVVMANERVDITQMIIDRLNG